VGHISKQHVRVFAFFSLALFMTGYAYALNLLGKPMGAVMVTAVAFALTGGLFREALRRT